MENFQKATKLKIRFNTTKGLLSVEELWDLSLQSLDNIAKAVNKDLKADSEDSFISTKTAVNTTLQLKLDILKEIIKVKLEEKEKSRVRIERAGQLETIKNLVATKKIEELGSKSLEDLNKMILELETEE